MKKTHAVLSFAKGGIVGILSLIPFISSGSVLYSLSVYENFLEGFKNSKKLFLYSIPVIIGLILGIFGGVHAVNYLASKIPNQIIFLVIGILIGGLRLSYKKHDICFSLKNIIIFLVILIALSLIYIFVLKGITVGVSSNIFFVLLSGLICGLALLIPGYPVSSSIIGVMTSSSIVTLVIFSLGTLLGLIIISKILSVLFNKFNNILHLIFISLVCVSIVILIFNISHFSLNFALIFTSILSLLWGYILVINLEKENDK